MTLRTDSGRMKLGGNLTLVESFQKKQPVKAASTPPAKTTNVIPKAATPPPKATKATNGPAKATIPLKTTNLPAKATSPLGGAASKTNLNKKPVLPSPGAK